MKKERPIETKRSFSSVEVGRTAACFSVVLLHAQPFAQAPDGSFFQPLHYLAIILTRWAVPFFFLASGFFFGRAMAASPTPGQVLARSAKKILLWYGLWVLIYGLAPYEFIKHTVREGWVNGLLRHIYWKALEIPDMIAADPWAFLMRGTRPHLWFLPALLISLSVITFFHKIKKPKRLALLSAATYGLAVYLGHYRAALPSVAETLAPEWKVYEHAGFLHGLFFTTVGWWWGVRHKIPALKPMALAAGFGFAAVLTEGSWNYFVLGLRPEAAFFLGIPFLSVGVFGVCLNFPTAGEKSTFAAWGIYTLGIYLLHVLVLEEMMRLGPWAAAFLSWGWDALLPLGVFFVSLGLVAGFRKLPGLKRLVS